MWWAQFARWSASARRPPAATASAQRYGDEVAVIDELGTLTFREIDERHERARPRAGRERDRRGRQRRLDVPQPPRLHRVGHRVLEARRQRAVPQHGLLGPQLTDVAQREQPKALIYDFEFEELIHDASRRRKRFIAWHDAEEGKPKDPLLEDLAASGDTAPVSPAERARQGDHPHVRHHGDAQGRLALAAQVARPGRRAAGHDPAQGAREDDDRRPDVPLLGLRALHARHEPVVDARAQAQVRSRGHAVR